MGESTNAKAASTPAKDSYSEDHDATERRRRNRSATATNSSPTPRATPAASTATRTTAGRCNFRYDEWGTLVRPMNLTTGVYRGGRRPIDLYWRIKGGIEPSGMPKTGVCKTIRRSGTW